MNRIQVREELNVRGVYFDEESVVTGHFIGTRFTFTKKELKKVEKTILKPLVKAHLKYWYIEAL